MITYSGLIINAFYRIGREFNLLGELSHSGSPSSNFGFDLPAKERRLVSILIPDFYSQVVSTQLLSTNGW